MLARAREKGLDGHDAARARASEADLPEFVAAGLFLDQYLDVLDAQSAIDYADLIRRAVIEAEAHRDELRAAVPPRLRRRVPGHRPRPGRAAPRARRRRRRPHRRGRPAPVDLRLPGCRGARHPRVPGRLPARATARPRRRGRAAAPPAASGRALLRGLPAGRPSARLHRLRSTPEARAPSSSPSPRRTSLGDGRVEVLTFDTERAEAEHLADLLRRAHLEDGVALVGHGGAGALRPGQHPGRCGASLVGGGRARRGRRRRHAAGRASRRVQPLLEALRAVVNLDNDDPEHPDFLDPDRAARAAGLAAGRPRRHRRPRPRPAAAAAREGAGGRRGARRRGPRRELLREVLVDPDVLAGADGPVAARVSGAGRGCCAAPGPGSTTAPPPRRCSGTLWAGTVLAGPAARLGRVRRARRPAGAPRPRRRLRALRDRRPRRGAARPHLGGQLPRHAGGPADPGRHASPSAACAATPCGC